VIQSIPKKGGGGANAIDEASQWFGFALRGFVGSIPKVGASSFLSSTKTSKSG
jgi:hypothetical protein